MRLITNTIICMLIAFNLFAQPEQSNWSEVDGLGNTGVTVFWRWRQELKDQFIHELKMVNNNNYKVTVQFKAQFECPDGFMYKDKTGQELDIQPGKEAIGQWAGLFYYPCNKTAAKKGGVFDFKVNHAVGNYATEIKPAQPTPKPVKKNNSKDAIDKFMEQLTNAFTNMDPNNPSAAFSEINRIAKQMANEIEQDADADANMKKIASILIQMTQTSDSQVMLSAITRLNELLETINNE